MAHVSNGADGILATANRGGTPKAIHDLKPTDEVTYMGQTMRLEIAERIGLITRDPHTGLYANVDPQKQAAVTKPPQEPEDPREQDPHLWETS
jgi:hypothetical protein